jgi:tripartite-type tricarboxylate transporter receptor subunit TctC
LLATLLVFTASGPTANAENYPTRPVRIILSVPAGNGPDVIGRVVADHLARLWGQQVVILNQPGASGATAIRAAGTSAPDGYALFLSTTSNYISLPEWKWPFDIAREFAPIGLVSESPLLVGVTPALGVNSLPELIAAAKKRPGEIRVGVGTLRGFLPHLTAEWLRRATGTDMTMVHYAGSAQAITDLIAGRVHVAIENLSVFEGPIAGGWLKPLASLRISDCLQCLTSPPRLKPSLASSRWAGSRWWPHPAHRRRLRARSATICARSSGAPS